jgi:CRISPR/Cas system-associated exonuclease Cas4 (RecB family)
VSSFRLGLTIVAVVAAFLATCVYVLLLRLRRRTGFTIADEAARIVASDTGARAPIMVRDSALGVRGTPDYVVEINFDGQPRLAPVEVKPTRQSKRLYDSDRVQLGAYLLGLRSTAGTRAAPFGFVRYATETFQVSLTSQLESDVRSIVEAIRAARLAAAVHRNHRSAARCASCAVRIHCDESLV